MSSNSSGDPMPVLIESALATLGREHPDGLRRVLATAGDLAVQIDVGDEPCRVEFTDGGVTVVAGRRERHDVLVATDRSTVALVLDGRLDLVRALDDDVLHVIGDLRAVVRALDVLVAFVTASVHAPEQQPRLGSFVEQQRVLRQERTHR